MNITLCGLNNTLKKFIFTFVFVLTCGVSVGIIFVNKTTNFSPGTAVERFNGSEVSGDDFEVQQNYAKSMHEMLMTTHNHLIGFSLIFFGIGIVFYFNTIIKGFWKTFLIVEPLISSLVSFSSIWGMRFIDPNFVYITVISAILMYVSFYIMALTIFYEILFKKNNLNKINNL